MNSYVCRLCGCCKPADDFPREIRRKCRKTACRACLAAQRRADRRAISGRREDVDPMLLTMVGAALCMWKGPVNREQPMRWKVAA